VTTIGENLTCPLSQHRHGRERRSEDRFTLFEEMPMILDDADTKKFTKTCKYVSLYLPIFDRYIPDRYKKFLKHSGNETKAKEAVKLGTGPKFKIRDTAAIIGKMANGFFWSKYPDDLYLDIVNARKFEKNPSKYEIALQYLLLHELIHYVRHHGKLADDDLPDGSDLGDAFEKDAYGRDMSHTWDSGAAKFDRGTIKI
jgi:hypothetical protein